MAHLQLVVMAVAALVLLCSFPLVSSMASPMPKSATTIPSGHDSVIDRHALLSIKSAISSDPRGSLAFWNDSIHFCQWLGVGCWGRRHPQRVTSLSLNSLDLGGYISPAIANLSFLKMVDLSDNHFQGPIPQEISQLPRLHYLNLSVNSLEGGIPSMFSHSKNLSFLSILSLYDNQLTGHIPLAIENLDSLAILYLDGNQLSGAIPSFLGNISKLRNLFLDENDFSGTIPPSLGNLSNLRKLFLDGNRLSSTIPTSLWNISSLISLGLSNNSLSGSLPLNAFQALPLLEFIDLFNNQLHGPIPMSLANASHIQQIAFHYNMFNGTVPPNLGNLQNLQVLNLISNQLEDTEMDGLNFLTTLTNCSNIKVLQLDFNNFGGMLPDSIGNFSTSLQFLTMGNNYISGNIPSSVENLASLTYLDLGPNLLSGSIPHSIGKLWNLHILDLGNNKISGEIPATVSNLTQLNELYLDFNELSGSIPTIMENCRYLTLLNLQANRLTGGIPKEIFRITSLSEGISLSHNLLGGAIPSEVGNLRNLESLDFSFNNLSGVLPSALSECAVLEDLYLGGNSFEGIIPRSLVSLTGLQVLDVSQNNLSGKVPDFLQGLQNLRHLNLSLNNFEGEVPTRGIFKNTSAVSVFGNRKLCGGDPAMHLPACPSPFASKNRHSHALLLITSIASSSLLLAFVSLLAAYFWVKRSRKSIPMNLSLTNEQNSRASYMELVRATDGFSKENLIGAGSVGTVYKGTLDHGNNLQVVAVKVLNLQIRGASKSFLSECEALRNVRHRSLVKIITVCSSVDSRGNDFKAIVFEFMANGSLEDWIHCKENQQCEPKRLSIIQRLNIAIDVAHALDYLHCQCDMPIVHCDMKPSNVLLDNSMTARVGDFGLAKILEEAISQPSVVPTSSISLKGTVGYIPPEYGMMNKVSTQGDVYSYGILLLEMFTAKRPTDEMFKEGQSLRKFVESAFPEQIMDIMDARLFLEEEEASTSAGMLDVPTYVECAGSVFNVGIRCSSELPEDRLKMAEVISELHKIRNNFAGNENARAKGALPRFNN